MRPFLWVDTYQKMGIWGCLQQFCKVNHCESWGIMLTFFNRHDYITSTGRVENSMLFDIVHEPIINIQQTSHQYLIPIFFNKKLLFIWSFKTKVYVDKTEMETIQLNLELLALHESYDKHRYPSFLVLLYPFTGTLSSVNEEIIQTNQRPIIFLNGQPGTGKTTFLQCFLLFHYGYLIKKIL